MFDVAKSSPSVTEPTVTDRSTGAASPYSGRSDTPSLKQSLVIPVENPEIRQVDAARRLDDLIFDERSPAALSESEELQLRLKNLDSSPPAAHRNPKPRQKDVNLLVEWNNQKAVPVSLIPIPDKISNLDKARGIGITTNNNYAKPLSSHQHSPDSVSFFIGIRFYYDL